MNDDSDGDFALFAAPFVGPIAMAILIVLAIVLYVVAADNKKECAARECPTGQTAKLMAHECVCVGTPK